jgi:hypothetical protein
LTRFAVAFAVLLAASAETRFQVTGDMWVKWCSEGAPLTDLASCGSYVRGVVDMIQLMQQPSAPEVAKVCIPNVKTGDDLAKIALPIIAALTERERAMPAVYLLWNAFWRVYPCQRLPP